jgi:hypothetical protein
MPAYNPQEFVYTSNQTAQPFFRYRVICTDMLTSATSSKDVYMDANGWCNFDAGPFAEQYISQVNPSNTYGFQTNTGALRQIRVNVGEVYGSTPTYYAGSNFDYYVWNGSLDFLSNDTGDFQNYVYTNYIYSTANNIQVLTNNHNSAYTWNPSANPEFYSYDENVPSSRSTYLSFVSLPNSLEKIQVVGFASNGAQLGSTVIGNTVSGSSGANQYRYIDVGYDGLLNMPSAQILSGTNPIPVSTYDYWIVYDVSSWLPQPGGPGQQNSYPLKRFNRICEPRFDVIELHYQTPEGNMESQVFPKMSLRTSEGTKVYYSQFPYYYSGYTPVYDYGVMVEKMLSATSKDKITINTDWLTENEVYRLRDVITSPIVYVDMGNSRGYLSVKVLDNSFTVNKKYNSSMLSVSMNLEFNHMNIRQRG